MTAHAVPHAVPAGTQLRADRSITVHVAYADAPWEPSPSPGVDRKLLERDGGEIARATSIVRYAAGSRFPSHVHGAGEELLVLDGVFSDERGDYPAGTYLRNPPGSKHRPFSVDGCTIFVKLRQIHPADAVRVVIVPPPGGPPAPAVWHRFGTERVELVHVPAGGSLTLAPHPAAGTELFVVDGDVRAGTHRLARHGWLRTPEPIQQLDSDAGAVCWLKRGHLS